MAGNLIRWKKGDYVKLGKAVSEFNKKIKQLQSEEINYLPDLKDYKDIKENIYSRSELNRIINSLKAINKENALDLYKTESGVDLTRWEAKEIKKAQKRALKSVNIEISKIQEGRASIGMGDERLRELEATKRSIENIDKKESYEFKRTAKRIFELGKKDRELKQDYLFRENFLKALEETSDFDNYDKLKDKLDSIKNPTKFYEFIKQSNIFMDLFIWYHDNSGTIVYGAFASNEDVFNEGLEQLGIDF